MYCRITNLVLVLVGFVTVNHLLGATLLAQHYSIPVKIGIAGLVHTHVHWILNQEKRGDFEIVGIAEPNADLARRYAKQHGFSLELVHPSLSEMLEKCQPEAVTAFNTTHGHLKVVQACAPKGIHVMVEKPLAVSLIHAEEMARLARTHQILLLTNYETTWYGSNRLAYQMVQEQKIGALRKIVVHSGHNGPKEIGVNKEFLDWLTDPKLNGGGAITDFGCYGVNLITWLMGSNKPSAVTAITQQIQPEMYPDVDDEATIILNYPHCQGVIQASWNWPFNRKDMEVYGVKGSIICVDRDHIKLSLSNQSPEREIKASKPPRPWDDPFSYLAAAVRGTLDVKPSDLSSIENNMIVVEILDAAKASAASGETVRLE